MAVQSIDRALDIVEVLRRSQHGLRLNEIANELGLNKTTAFRIAGTLVQRGFIEKEATTGRYRIGLAFVDVASRYLNEVELTTEAAPHLHALSQSVGHTAFLAVRKGDQLVYLDKVEQFNSIRRYAIIGHRKPLHCTALGKALLLGYSCNERAAILGREPYSARTLGTITRLDLLCAQLSDAARVGWTRDDEEDEVGTRCIAAPVRDYRGLTIAAVSVSWPLASEAPAESAIAGAVTGAAGAISRRMGRAEI